MDVTREEVKSALESIDKRMGAGIYTIVKGCLRKLAFRPPLKGEATKCLIITTDDDWSEFRNAPLRPPTAPDGRRE